MLLQIHNVSISFNGVDILKKCAFHMEDREKCALVGINGAGKTTLLRIIVGETEPESGSVTLSAGRSIGYLSQQDAVNTDNSIYEEILSVKRDILNMETNIRILEQEMKHLTGEALDNAMNRYSLLTHEFEMQDGYSVKSAVTGVIKGLGFTSEEFDTPVNHLSGGQKTRVALGKLLLKSPDLIILDEPTNHLDIAAIEWLEGYLKSYSGAVLIVSHDRYFLDRIVSRVFELENGILSSYKGNYTAFAEKKKALRDAAKKAYLKDLAERKHEEEVIEKLRQFNREKSIKRAESRVKLLEKRDIVEKPAELNDAMKLTITPSIISGNDVLTVSGLSKSFPGTELFSDLSFELKRGERVALIGRNGAGKTTILKILTGLVKRDSGYIRFGTNVHIGYYDQEQQVLHDEKTLFEELNDAYPHLNNTKIRNTLASFLFTGDDVFKKVSALSGGERGRLSLAKLMLSNANFLILDEPTNHLDITSKEILEEALLTYEGTVFYVSHDRYFVNSTATRILDLTGQTLVNYIGNYDYYLEKREELKNAALDKDDSKGGFKEGSQKGNTAFEQGGITESGQRGGDGKNISENKLSWQENKEKQARIRKIKNAIKRLEDEIEKNEMRSSEIDSLLSREEIATDPEQCASLASEQEGILKKNELLMEEWEKLQEEL